MKMFFVCKTLCGWDVGKKIFIQIMSERIFPSQQQKKESKKYANNLREISRRKKQESFFHENSSWVSDWVDFYAQFCNHFH